MHRQGKCASFSWHRNVILAGLCWLIGLAFFVVYMTSYTGLYFNLDQFCWLLVENGTLTLFIDKAEVYTTFPALAFTFIMYLIIFIFITLQKFRFSTKHKLMISSEEVGIVIRAFIVFVYVSTMITAWHYGDSYLPNSVWTGVAINLAWIFYCGFNSMLNLLFNRTIRSKCFQKVGIGTNSTTVTVLSVTSTL
ncbi:hypothetical protein QR680_006183 [Steinernema hermaphroditum]|uniref:Uncharacterized protein n=1 Tax=Steinernema hermaphroditum TaxID=289476 RepID=A0AA39LWP8_9BILA|nr:hypothetical protein QR680_006183 [Steinernema hermaphroditum]